MTVTNEHTQGSVWNWKTVSESGIVVEVTRKRLTGLFNYQSVLT